MEDMLFMKWMQSLTASTLWESIAWRAAAAAGGGVFVAFSDDEEVTFRFRPLLAAGYIIRKAATTIFPPTSLRYLIGAISHLLKLLQLLLYFNDSLLPGSITRIDPRFNILWKSQQQFLRIDLGLGVEAC